MKNPDQPRTWHSRPAIRFNDHEELSPLSIDENGQVYFTTDVQPIDYGMPLLRVDHPIGSFGRGLRILDHWEKNGRLPW